MNGRGDALARGRTLRDSESGPVPWPDPRDTRVGPVQGPRPRRTWEDALEDRAPQPGKGLAAFVAGHPDGEGFRS